MPKSNLGADLLDDIDAFLARFVAYPSDEARYAHVLWILHTHLMQCWGSTPRLAFLSPEAGSGKTRCLELTGLLVPNPVEAVSVSSAYLFRKIGDPAGLPTILFDEVDTLFGLRVSTEAEEVRGLLNAGHRRGAVVGRCTYKGKKIITEELPAFCAVALAGLGDLPDTIMTRSVVIRMKRRKQSEYVEPYRERLHAAQGERLKARIEEWAKQIADPITRHIPDLPDSVVDRNADVWEPLVAIADFAGNDWPHKARVTAVSNVSALREGGMESLSMRLLADIRALFEERKERGGAYWHNFATKLLLEKLIEIPETPFIDTKGLHINDLRLARLLKKFTIKSKQVRITADTTVKGYTYEDFVDVWERYLPPIPPAQERETAKQPETELGLDGQEGRFLH